MTATLQLHEIKNTIQQFLPDASVLLFGSRARGDEKLQSDFDLLIITGAVMDLRQKMQYEKKIRQSLTESFEQPFDIILQTQEEWRDKKEQVGHIAYYASKEGVEI